MLRTNEQDPTHVLDQEVIEVDERVTYVEKPVKIEDRKEQVLTNKTI